MMLNEGFNHHVHVDKCCDVHHADESILEDFEDLGFGGCCECYIYIKFTLLVYLISVRFLFVDLISSWYP